MDLVVNHCSDEHKWFQKAKADPEGPYGKYFYIKKGIDGKAPNNWRSIFGGSAWEPIEGTDYYYLHIFTKKQPDLNWENKELREEIYKMVNWWLDKGIGGFRLDAITYLKKEAGLPSYPATEKMVWYPLRTGALNQPGIGSTAAGVQRSDIRKKRNTDSRRDSRSDSGDAAFVYFLRRWCIFYGV